MKTCTAGVNKHDSVLAVLSLSALNRRKSGRSTLETVNLCYVMPHF